MTEVSLGAVVENDDIQTIKTVSSDSEVTQLRLIVAEMKGMLTTALANLSSDMTGIKQTLTNVQSNQQSISTDQATMKQQIINLEHDVKEMKSNQDNDIKILKTRNENAASRLTTTYVMPIIAVLALITSAVALFHH